MNLATFQIHKSWFVRAALVLLVTVLADGAVVWFAQRPLLWAVLIPSTLPLSLLVFVALPILRETRHRSRSGGRW